MPDVKLVRLVADAGGDVRAADSDELRDVVMSALDAQGEEHYVNDEDGGRYEWFDPMDDPEVAGKVNSTLADLREMILQDGSAIAEPTHTPANSYDRAESMDESVDDEIRQVRQVSAYGYRYAHRTPHR